MSITTQESIEYDKVYTDVPPTKLDTATWKGRVRSMFVSHTQDGVGDIGSSVALCKLPAGKVRLLGKLSALYINWVTGSETVDIGWDAYTDEDGDTVTADPNGLDAAVSVETAGYFPLCSVQVGLDAGTYVFESKDGVTLRATSPTVALANGDTLAGVIYYVTD